jgi:MFS family permease
MFRNARFMTDPSTVFHYPMGSLLGIFGAMPGFGGLAVLPFAPYLADCFGRRNGTALDCLFILMGALLQAFPPPSHPTQCTWSVASLSVSEAI